MSTVERGRPEDWEDVVEPATQLPLSTFESPQLLGTCICGHGLLEHRPCDCSGVNVCLDHLGSCEWCGCARAEVVA